MQVLRPLYLLMLNDNVACSAKFGEAASPEILKHLEELPLEQRIHRAYAIPSVERSVSSKMRVAALPRVLISHGNRVVSLQSRRTSPSGNSSERPAWMLTKRESSRDGN